MIRNEVANDREQGGSEPLAHRGGIGREKEGKKRASARSHERHKIGPIPANTGNYRYG